NWPGLTASALGDACTTRCLYSEFTQSWATTGQSTSSAGICACAATGALLPTTKGAEANTSWVEDMRGCFRDRAAPVLLGRPCPKIKICSNFCTVAPWGLTAELSLKRR